MKELKKKAARKAIQTQKENGILDERIKSAPKL
jgi:hypothetical protein